MKISFHLPIFLFLFMGRRTSWDTFMKIEKHVALIFVKEGFQVPFTLLYRIYCSLIHYFVAIIEFF